MSNRFSFFPLFPCSPSFSGALKRKLWWTVDGSSSAMRSARYNFILFRFLYYLFGCVAVIFCHNIVMACCRCCCCSCCNRSFCVRIITSKGVLARSVFTFLSKSSAYIWDKFGYEKGTDCVPNRGMHTLQICALHLATCECVQVVYFLNYLCFNYSRAVGRTGATGAHTEKKFLYFRFKSSSYFAILHFQNMDALNCVYECKQFAYVLYGCVGAVGRFVYVHNCPVARLMNSSVTGDLFHLAEYFVILLK